MNVVWWVAGVLATIAGIKFVFAVFKRLTSKETVNYAIDSAKDGIAAGADRVSDWFKKRKEEKDNEKPIVTIH